MEGCMGSSGWSQQANMKHTTPPRDPDRKCNPSGFEAGSQTPCPRGSRLRFGSGTNGSGRGSGIVVIYQNPMISQPFAGRRASTLGFHVAQS